MTGDKFLYIIRHGETDFNKKSIVQGSGVDTDLNEEGRRQAELFYRHYRDHPFDRIFISDLKRTRQSVQGFIDAGLPVTRLAGLNEISWGEFEGKPASDEQQKQYQEVVEKWIAGDHHARVVSGESPYDLQQRQIQALEQILANAHEKQVLICMHGRAMKSFMCLLLNEPLSKMEDYRHSNLCLYIVKKAGERFELVTHCDVEHLQ